MGDEREVGLVAKDVGRVTRVCLILPKDGNTVEYMAIDKGQPGFDAILTSAMVAAEAIAHAKFERQSKESRERRRKQYLALKEEFGEL